ncbi:GFA family protein [uncultured Shewanella sp.]|uniref:GFA family protein n=1 Tax=uncultured Shewanella sp. TaxID=173975 RepID=UPI002612F58F|nr:GFA family protein [uncultured Shewanella sp.]
MVQDEKKLKRVIKGACNCTGVMFEVTTSTSDIYICHCSICRQATGTNGIAVIVVNKQDFSWLKGESSINTWRKPDHDWETSFCPTCGSNLPGMNDDERMYIPAGLLTEGAELLSVAHHIWVDSKAPWDHIADVGKQHLKAFMG